VLARLIGRTGNDLDPEPHAIQFASQPVDVIFNAPCPAPTLRRPIIMMSGRPFLRREEEVPAGAAGAANAGMGGEAVSGRSACGTPPAPALCAPGRSRSANWSCPRPRGPAWIEWNAAMVSLSSSQRGPSPECPHAEFLSLYAMQRPSPAPPDTARQSLGQLPLAAAPCTALAQSMGLARGMGREDGKRDYASDRMNRHRFRTTPSSQSQKSEQDCQ
jgi:hypothetical protein